MIRRATLVLAACLASQALMANTASPRIVGGTDANDGWKTLVALVSKSAKQYAIDQEFPSPVYQAQFCGGTLLSKDWVLTAAHCLDGMPSSDLEIMVGSQSLEIAANSTLLKDAASIHIHPDYNSANSRNDIALIRLGEAANPGLSTVSTAVLAIGTTDEQLQATLDYNDILSALGWGVDSYDSPSRENALYPKELQQVAIDYLTNANCQNLYNANANGETIYQSMICAYEPNPDAEDDFGEDSCQGDSGGPLFVTGSPLNDSPQVGVTSFGYECGNTVVPGVYSRVSNFTGWIENVTNISGIELRNLTIGENNLPNQGVGSFPLHIPVKNAGNRSATGFSLKIEHSSSLTISASPEEPGLECTSGGWTETNCTYSGPEIAGNATTELALTANDSGGRTTGSEELSVTVTLDDYRDYHRLDDSGIVPIYFGKPTLNISAEAFCLNPGDSNVQMRVEATLSNSSEQIYSEGTRVTGSLPEGVTLVGNASPDCSLTDDLFTCVVGNLNAGSELTAIIAVTAAPDTLETLEAELENDNGIAMPGSTLSSSVELDFSREDLPTCPAIPAPVSNLTSGGGSSGGGGAPAVVMLSILVLLGVRRRH